MGFNSATQSWFNIWKSIDLIRTTLKKKNVIYAIWHSTEEQRLHILFK